MPAEPTTRHFITVSRFGHGPRGVFCEHTGKSCIQDEPFTKDEMDDAMGVFSLIFAPQSTELTETQLHEYTTFVPFPEYSNVWGMVVKPTELKQHQRDLGPID